MRFKSVKEMKNLDKKVKIKGADPKQEYVEVRRKR